ncbi:hypothetical protein [Acidithiobacillus concretivorus]|uniref:hypothetical protein n=1 Tax=Acidithiobacillus concretivorus TaxID=3063952 RepID=UPI001D023F67|nr:hypothetical protein [Acidithiobacillus concretivorus]
MTVPITQLSIWRDLQAHAKTLKGSSIREDADPAETLFIVSSKTFTTLATMTNARRRISGLFPL